MPVTDVVYSKKEQKETDDLVFPTLILKPFFFGKNGNLLKGNSIF